MFDLLIVGGMVYDGSGGAAFAADIGVKDGKIAAIGHLADKQAKKVINARGKTVTPGFIDMHSHADCSVPMWPDMENLLGQGITTCFAGQCGFSVVPVSKYWLEMDFEQAAMNKMLPEFPGGPIPDPQRVARTEDFIPVFETTYGEKLDWGEFGSYVRHLNREGIGCNMSFQIGHSQLRQEAMGLSFNRAATEEELQCMEEMLAAAMEQGAWGLSIGLDYKPSTYAGREELLRLMQVVGRYNGVVTAHVQLRHMRAGILCEGHQSMDGYREFLELGKAAGVHVHISHLINGFSGDESSAAENAKKTIALIRSYQEQGVHVSWDTLPFSTVAMFHFPQLANYLRPYVDRCGGLQEFARVLRQTNYGQLIAEEIREGKHLSCSVFSRIDPKQNPGWAENLRIEVCKNTEYVGKKLAALASERGCDAVEMLVAVVAEDPETLCSKNRRFDKESYYIFEQEVDACFGTDNGCCNYDTIYREKPDYPFYASTPSAFCGMIRCIEDSRLTKEQLVAALTGRAAQAAGYRNRGLLKVSFAADILVLDWDHLKSNFNELQPGTPPSGIDYVIVNGAVAVEKGRHTHARSGQTMLREGRAQ